MSTTPSPTATRAIMDGFRSLFRPPFRWLILISLFSAVTSTTFSVEPSETEIALSFLLLVVSIYVQISIILAAGASDPDPSADAWLRGAVRRRCFWRFVGTSLFVVLGLFAGTLLLVVGAFLVGALLGLAQSACVVERRLPMDAVSRSARVGNQARVQVGIVFGLLILVPTVATQGVAVMGWSRDIGPFWALVLAVAEILSAAGTIALTRLFVALGGDATPPLDRLAPAKPAPPP